MQFHIPKNLHFEVVVEDALADEECTVAMATQSQLRMVVRMAEHPAIASYPDIDSISNFVFYLAIVGRLPVSPFFAHY